MRDVTALLLTHIHLDHAGATGSLVRENPALRVYVHERGAPHLVDPSKLLASASLLYGDAMERLWGEVSPVPASALTVLKGGERIEEGGRQLEVAYTPGHASHHVSYFNADTGIAFVGDTGGIKIVENGYVLPPTPPPDINLEAWDESLRTIEAWRPDTLVPHALRTARQRRPTHRRTARPSGARRRPRQDIAGARRLRRRARGLVLRGAPPASCAGGWETRRAVRTRSPPGSI